MVTYILIFAYLTAIDPSRKTCAGTIAETLATVLMLRRFFLHYSEADLKQLLVYLYVTFDAYILKSW